MNFIKITQSGRNMQGLIFVSKNQMVELKIIRGIATLMK